MVGEQPDAAPGGPVAQLSSGEGALCRIDLQVVLVQEGKTLVKMAQVLLYCPTCNEMVIQVMKTKGK